MTTIGRQVAHHALYPDSYVPRKPAKRELASELSAEIRAFLKSKTWFWAVAISAFTWLAYHFVKWAMSVPGAMRIGQ